MVMVYYSKRKQSKISKGKRHMGPSPEKTRHKSSERCMGPVPLHYFCKFSLSLKLFQTKKLIFFFLILNLNFTDLEEYFVTENFKHIEKYKKGVHHNECHVNLVATNINSR